MDTFYNIIFSDGHIIHMMNIPCQEDLLRKFKDAKIEGNKFLSWEFGCLSMDSVLGIYYYPTIKK